MSLAEGFAKLQEVCAAVTASFSPSLIMLQAEKMMNRLMMVGKKKYIYRIYLGPTDKGNLSFKGVELARRDNCALVVDVMTKVVEEVMSDHDDSVGRAIDIVDTAMCDLVSGSVDISKLVIAKAITRAKYKDEPMQVSVAKTMASRDPSYTWSPGDRIPFIVVGKTSGFDKSPKKMSQRVEDPLWAITHGMEIDAVYYIQKQLGGPLSRIFMYVMMTEKDKISLREAEEELRKLEVSNDDDDDCDDQDGGKTALAAAIKRREKIIAKIRTNTERKLFGPRVMALLDGNSTIESSLFGQSASSSSSSSSKSVSSPSFLPAMRKLTQYCANRKGTLAADKKRPSLVQIDIEELTTLATKLKEKCDKCRGYPDDKLNCTARDCPTLLQRASVIQKLSI